MFTDMVRLITITVLGKSVKTTCGMNGTMSRKSSREEAVEYAQYLSEVLTEQGDEVELTYLD
jgi:hypothetical protein